MTDLEQRCINPGLVFVNTGKNESVPLKIVALVSTDRAKNAMGLVWLGGHNCKANINVYGTQNTNKPVGRLLNLSDSFNSSVNLDPLFGVIDFSNKPPFDFSAPLVPAAVSKNLRLSLFGRGKVRVRKAGPFLGNTADIYEFNHDLKCLSKNGKKPSLGIITGEIVNTFMKVGHDEITIPRTAVIRGKGGKCFSCTGDGGLPVLSNSGALCGFIIGQTAQKTIMITAEQLRSLTGMEFLTLDTIPDGVFKLPRSTRRVELVAN